MAVCVDGDYRSGAARSTKNQQIYSAIDGYLDSVVGESEAYRLAFAFHDKIIENIDYARDSAGDPVTENWAHGVEGVFARGAAVCEGYAKAFSLLLNACGVENVYVTGMSNGEGHAWNMVKIDGAWYWYDLTWDDQPNIANGIIYDYFCKSDATFADHSLSVTGDMSYGINFLYDVPAAATQEYDSAALEYGETFTVGNFSYQVCGFDCVSIVGCNSSVTGGITLTESVTYDEREYTLSQIGRDAFSGETRLTSLVIPSTVNVIYNFAFDGCTRLSSVTFEDKSGWQRTVNGVTTQIDASSLESVSEAAGLLKETYVSGGYKYQYVWKKTAS
ncbi:MAG: transglutaminase domain-containing protein [Candidatus Coproplasma sp.]